jgi:anti-anti-sigma factor
MGELRTGRIREGVLEIGGEIDISTAQELLDVALAERGLGDLVLDCADVTLIDSTGIQALLRVRDALDGGTLVIRNPSHRVAAVFELVQAETWPRFHVEPTLSETDGRSA